MNTYRTHHCNAITEALVGTSVALAGWVDTVRDHGGIIFIDLRDHYGVTQLVADPSVLPALGKEWVIKAEGKVALRDAETVNKKISTGMVELRVDRVAVLSEVSETLPFEISDSKKTREDVRLKYRFLDLRNPVVHERILLRAEVISHLRTEMTKLGFLEFQTPILTASSPEGARDYLVPSRKHHGKFYALPQAPQQFKQLLMVSGFDKYFQVAPCFRDEDARADRSPGEFYQLDFEMSFAGQEDVFSVAEEVLYNTFKKFTDKPVSAPPFVRIPYEEAMLSFGSDKPDLRNPLRIQDLSAFFAEVDFKPFKGKPVRGIVAPGCAKMSKSFFEKMLDYATEIGMKGLGYISAGEGMELKGPIVKFLDGAQQAALIAQTELQENGTLFFISDTKKAVNGLAGQIRTALGDRLGIIDKNRFEFCFIVDYPMYGENEETGEIEFTHNPFSMPQGGMDALLNKDPLDILAYQYDIVVNGVELSSGAVRNHLPEVMVKAFEIAGYSKETVESKFPALFRAFHYGAPPHAGMAPGIDRIVMLLAGEENIREVIAFPMNSSTQDILMGAPNEVSEKQLREVHIKIR